MPKRFSFPMREIWLLQPRLERRRGKAPYRLLEHPRFRAAYDFLLLRSEAGEAPKELARLVDRFPDAERRASGLPWSRRRRRKSVAAGRANASAAIESDV